MGGDTRHFATLVQDLQAHGGFKVRLVNTSRGAQHSSLLHNLRVTLRVLASLCASWRRVDVVSFHASDRGMLLCGPLVVVIGRLLGMRVVLRLFGGSFGDFYADANPIVQWIMRRFILSSDAVLLQTQRMIRQLQPQSSGNLVWFSTYIKAAPHPVTDETIDPGATCDRFVFLGHLWRTKGIEIILGAAGELPARCSIDVYGPLDEYSAESINDRGLGRVRYCGVLTHEQVDTALWGYDCLVLPTHHPGEGYPGVIVEAFAHALPVVTTRWRAIPEIVDDSCGILIEPENSAEFLQALLALHQDRDRWRRLKSGARARALEFDHAVWSTKFTDLCERLVHS
jgi:glycosyltransferase involved in cell wall biosynthesis